MAATRAFPRNAPLTVAKPELTVEGSDAAFRQFIHDFLAFSSRTEQCRSGFGKMLGLSGTAYTILISIAHLGQKETEIGVSRVAEQERQLLALGRRKVAQHVVGGVHATGRAADAHPHP